MTCKDCFYHAVCKDDLKDKLHCSEYKPISRIIELPCAIGETAYIITLRKSIAPCKVVGVHISTITTRDKSKCDYVIVYFENTNSTERISFKKIGTVLCFSKEEAEKRLGELKGDKNG